MLANLNQAHLMQFLYFLIGVCLVVSVGASEWHSLRFDSRLGSFFLCGVRIGLFRGSIAINFFGILGL